MFLFLKSRWLTLLGWEAINTTVTPKQRINSRLGWWQSPLWTRERQIEWSLNDIGKILPFFTRNKFIDFFLNYVYELSKDSQENTFDFFTDSKNSLHLNRNRYNGPFFHWFIFKVANRYHTDTGHPKHTST